ncbi:MAG: GntR family transcriptional regulator [Muribaculaceae bacterium]|nr:GntR family transcriptional regulator [Muribaculaceae bacterium]
MVFEESNKAIYIQIADRICNEILDGLYLPDSRLPSVREYASDLQVNANTVMRSYDRLSQKGVIYNRRGIGFFVSPDAKEKILSEKAELLMDSRINELFDLLYHLEISPDNLKAQYMRFIESKNKEK